MILQQQVVTTRFPVTLGLEADPFLPDACAERPACARKLDNWGVYCCGAANDLAASQQHSVSKGYELVSTFHLLPEMLTHNGDGRFPPPEGALPTEKAYRGFLRLVLVSTSITSGALPFEVTAFFCLNHLTCACALLQRTHECQGFNAATGSQIWSKRGSKSLCTCIRRFCPATQS